MSLASLVGLTLTLTLPLPLPLPLPTPTPTPNLTPNSNPKQVPLASLVGASAVGDGLAMTAAAILGKFLSGAWAAPLVTPDGCATFLGGLRLLSLALTLTLI